MSLGERGEFRGLVSQVDGLGIRIWSHFGRLRSTGIAVGTAIISRFPILYTTW